MRIVIVSLALTLLSHSALAQKPAAPNPAPPLKGFASAADIAAFIAKAKSERNKGEGLISLPLTHLSPSLKIDYHAAVVGGALHKRDAELFYVIEGSGTIVTGGKLIGEKRTNAENLSGTGIDGGASRHVAKGDFIMVPENTPHWFSAIDGSMTVMSLHLPGLGNAAR